MKLKRFYKPRFLLVYPLAVWLFIAANTTEGSFALGGLVVLLGEALRLWANGYVGHVKVNWTQKWRGDAKIGQLMTAGPYAYVRHPLYLGTFLLGLGFCIIVGSWWLTLAALAFFLVIYGRKMAQEERILLDECGEAFARYRRAVSQWLPTWRRYPGGEGRWGWEGIMASREPKTLIWVTVMLILLYFREELIQEREALWTQHTFKHIFLLGLAVVLMLSDGIFELVRRWRKRHAAPPAASADSSAPPSGA